MADSAIASFDAKYAYNFWRPVTAIRAADTDGNPETATDPAWLPLIVTPAHPSYVAFHASLSESAAQALASFFATHPIHSPPPPPPTPPPRRKAGRGWSARTRSSLRHRGKRGSAAFTGASTGASTSPSG